MKNGSTLRTTKSTLAFNILNADAALAVIKSATTADVGALVQLLKHENSEVRKTSAKELANIGPTVKEVIPALIQALEYEKYGVPSDAAKALAEIGPETVNKSYAHIKFYCQPMTEI